MKTETNCNTCNFTGKYTAHKFTGIVSLYCNCRAGRILYHADCCLKRETCPSLRGIITCPCECHEETSKMNPMVWKEFCSERGFDLEFVEPELREAIMCNPELRELALRLHRDKKAQIDG